MSSEIRKPELPDEEKRYFDQTNAYRLALIREFFSLSGEEIGLAVELNVPDALILDHLADVPFLPEFCEAYTLNFSELISSRWVNSDILTQMMHPPGVPLDMEASSPFNEMTIVSSIRAKYLMLGIHDVAKKGGEFDHTSPHRRLTRRLVASALRRSTPLGISCPDAWTAFADSDNMAHELLSHLTSDKVAAQQKLELARGMTRRTEGGDPALVAMLAVGWHDFKDRYNIEKLSRLFSTHPDPEELARLILDPSNLEALLRIQAGEISLQ